MRTITLQQSSTQTQSTAGWLARTGLLATTRTAGVFVGSNLFSGFCHRHLPEVIYQINYGISQSLGLTPAFGSVVSYIGLGYSYNYADQIIRSVGGAAGYYTADLTTNAALYVFDRLTSRTPAPVLRNVPKQVVRDSWNAKKLPKGKELMPAISVDQAKKK